MKADLKAKWVEALRSGKYEQGVGALLKDGKYCCLGVLACVMDREIPLRGIHHVAIGDTVVEDDGKEVGYSFFEPLLGSVPHTDLAHRNDRGDSFKAIADYIEANIPTDEHSVADASA